jgi:hypothetical protein
MRTFWAETELARFWHDPIQFKWIAPRLDRSRETLEPSRIAGRHAGIGITRAARETAARLRRNGASGSGGRPGFRTS